MNPVDDPIDRALRAELSSAGLASAPELAAALGVSVSTARRRLDACGVRVARTGRARAVRYGWREPLDGLADPLPLYEVDLEGGTRHVADLTPLARGRVLVEGRDDRFPSALYEDLPWYLWEIRPQGWLGRLVPRRHPELGLPGDILLWSTRHVLAWAARHAWDPVGALVLGGEALERFGRSLRDAPVGVRREERADVWEGRADALTAERPGSSAGGEQPKLLDVVEGTPVLVKWSPPVDSRAAERVADLLRAEAHALDALAADGIPAAKARIVTGRRRVMLEVERFDRVGPYGRIGQAPLFAVDAEFVGSEMTWRASARALGAAGVLGAADVARVLLLDRFAALIGHSDRHMHNLSVRLDGARPAGLAPAYDLAPMRWALVNGEVVDREPEAPSPAADDAPHERRALRLAREQWARVAEDPCISANFRSIARSGLRAMDAVEADGGWLPR